jgi:hypothetical protein
MRPARPTSTALPGLDAAPPSPGRPGIVPLELVEQPAGAYALRALGSRTLAPPDGTYNFVRVQGARPGPGDVYLSPRLPHADLAQGRPVIYAGTAGFERGTLVWWSNYSGTYQPIAALRDRARLPLDRFVPWERLQAGGLAQQRVTFASTTRAAPPALDPRPKSAPARASGPDQTPTAPARARTRA